jgi:hypothetical protein
MGWYKESACTNAWDFATDKITYNNNTLCQVGQNNVHFESLGGRDIEDITLLPSAVK